MVPVLAGTTQAPAVKIWREIHTRFVIDGEMGDSLYSIIDPVDKRLSYTVLVIIYSFFFNLFK